MRVALISGTRRQTRLGVISQALNTFSPDLILVGDAAGVDAEARNYARVHRLRYMVAPAAWDKMGPSAGPHRNETLVLTAMAFCASHDVHCFLVPDAESVGTLDTLSRIRAACLPHTVL